MRRVRAFVAIAVLLAAACDRPAKPAGPSARAGLIQGRAAAAAWLAAGASDTTSTTTVLALGYMERLRLGLGSPFRLIDYALEDPRLPDTGRVTLAWSLLARTLDGHAYDIDEAALDRAGVAAVPSWPGVGRRHLEIIADAIDEARDARSGELAVRLGYSLAAMEGSLPAHAPRYSAQAAALLRDRRIAIEDATNLVRTAQKDHVDALDLLQRWRAERRFSVEAPHLGTLPQDGERDALVRARRIARALRELGEKQDQITAARVTSAAGVHTALLTAPAARALLALSNRSPMPPLAPLVVGTRGYHEELVAQPWLTAAERQRRRGLEKAGTEERFAAQFALLERTSPYDVVPSLVAMWSAVGMRSMGQEPVWFPGFAAPSSRELTQRYGLTSVTFGASVPSTLRPYYRRMLDVAIADLRRVLPELNLRGLSVRFQEVGADAGTLAMHDPSKRRLLLPPSTAAGTLAHEIAHDIDWQVALRRYHVRGDYASDRAVRAGSSRGDRLALRMQDLAVGATMPVSTSTKLATHARRPTEVLARNIDWFVSVALANQGRTNGYLSSVQDEVLTGYGTVQPPEVTGVAADALVNILDQIAPIYPETRTAFLRSYGSGRSLRSYDLARRVFEAPIPDARGGVASAITADTRVFDGIAHARALGDAAVDAWTCRAPGGAYSVQLEEARRELVSDAAAARARGYAVRRARMLMGRDAGKWVAGQLFGGPWHVDGVSDEMEAYLGDLVRGARSVVAPPEIAKQEGFELTAPPARCSEMAVTARF